MKLNSFEHRKGEDYFSMDKGLFYAFLYEELGQEVLVGFIRTVSFLIVCYS